MRLLLTITGVCHTTQDVLAMLENFQKSLSGDPAKVTETLEMGGMIEGNEASATSYCKLRVERYPADLEHIADETLALGQRITLLKKLSVGPGDVIIADTTTTALIDPTAELERLASLPDPRPENPNEVN